MRDGTLDTSFDGGNMCCELLWLSWCVKEVN